MKDFGLFSERDAAAAARKLDDLVRFADRRERLLEHIDLDSLDRNTAFDILETDEALAETISATMSARIARTRSSASA